MNNLTYHESSPENNNQSGFTEFSSVDFVLDAPSRKLLKNSIRLEAVVIATQSSANGRVVPDYDVKLDNKIGGHAFIESCVVSMPMSKGVVQNAQEYSRYVAQIATASYEKNDYFSSDLQAELRGALEWNGRVAVQQIASDNTTGTQDPQDPTFSIKPLICLNNSTGGNYSFNDNGMIRLSFNLAKVHNALFGADCKNDTSYTLTDMRIRYMTIPEDNAKDKMIMNSYSMVKNSIVSNSANISVRVPSSAVGGVSINFLEQSRESSITHNYNALMPYPRFQEVNYGFADSTSQFISYTITDLGDALHKGVESLKRGGANEVNMNAYSANKGYVLGLDFNGEYIDLSSNKFSMNLKSKASNLSPHLVYLYFHTLLVV
tara:strand:- start:9027 stop:10154 length:1128 start_codon:yes stop_codon:yes gene_type:complete